MPNMAYIIVCYVASTVNSDLRHISLSDESVVYGCTYCGWRSIINRDFLALSINWGNIINYETFNIDN